MKRLSLYAAPGSAALRAVSAAPAGQEEIVWPESAELTYGYVLGEAVLHFAEGASGGRFTFTVKAYSEEEAAANKAEVDRALDEVVGQITLFADKTKAADLNAVTENLMLPAVSGMDTVWTSSNPDAIKAPCCPAAGRTILCSCPVLELVPLSITTASLSDVHVMHTP